MVFPVYLGVGAFKLRPHFVFEVAAYEVAIGLLLGLQGKTVVGALLGSLIGVELTKKWTT